MTAPAIPKLLAPIVITANSNDDIRYEAQSAGTATIAAGTYYISGDGAADDLCLAIKTALDTASSATWTVAVSTTTHLVAIRCNTTDSSAWSIDWDYSAGGFNGFVGTVLGVSSLSAAFGDADNAYDYADVIHSYSWYPDAAPSTDDGHAGITEATESDVAQHRAQSGAVWTVRTGGPFETRLVTFEGLARNKVITPDSVFYTEANESLQTFIATYAYAGQRLRYYPSYSDAHYFDCVLDEETLRQYRPRRLAPGVALYGIDIGMRGYVA
jgi:hypothetical protein